MLAVGGIGSGRRELVRFEVPLDARYVGLVRGVAATVVAAVPDVEEDRIDDVRVAVSEACTLVGASEARGAGGAALVLTCAIDGGWVRVEVSSTGRPSAGTAGSGVGPEPGWGPRLLEALVDEVVIVDGEEPTVRLGVRGTPRREDPTP